jgi:hypothetical protein
MCRKQLSGSDGVYRPPSARTYHRPPKSTKLTCASRAQPSAIDVFRPIAAGQKSQNACREGDIYSPQCGWRMLAQFVRQSRSGAPSGNNLR